MIIGLTGGIASGKSTVSKYLKEKNIPIVDADLVSRQVVEPGTKGLKALEKAFGHNVISNGQLDRLALRKIVFSNQDSLELLNSILHPIIHETIEKQIDDYIQSGHERIIFDAPLLLENQLKGMVDVLWVVACDQETQIKRVMVRDDMSRDEALAIINKQMPLNEKVKMADLVIYNDDSIESLYAQIDHALDAL
jgi:dephospho-CoA kinase